MTKHNIKLKKDQAYIQLNKVLQIIGVAQTGGHAKILIQNNLIMLTNKKILLITFSADFGSKTMSEYLYLFDLVTVGDVLIKIE